MRHTYTICAFSALLSLCACIKPAEEIIEDTGGMIFSASFNVPAGMQALWSGNPGLIVVDSRDKVNRFSMDSGTGAPTAEFSGIISPSSTVKYVAYAEDLSNVSYDSATASFTLQVPAAHNAKAPSGLVAAGNAAIGILQGSEVELYSACGFLKFSLEPNGQVLNLGGVEHNLGDIRSITITDNDGKSLAGTIRARWSDETKSTICESIEEGSSTITFYANTLKTPEGEICYEAGEYCIPVIPQEYENISITVTDAEGRQAVAVRKRSVNVSESATSNLSGISWPTTVVSVNLKCASASESANNHPDINAWPRYNYEVDRVSETTGQVKEGEAQRRTVVDFTEGGMNYQVWASEGYAKYVLSGGVLIDILLNNYYTHWSNGGDKWTGGSTDGYAWIRIPEYNGVLYKVELEVLSRSQGPVHLALGVDAESGAPENVLYTLEKTPKSAFSVFSFPVLNGKVKTPYYLVFGDGYYYRVRSWKLYYKVYE